MVQLGIVFAESGLVPISDDVRTQPITQSQPQLQVRIAIMYLSTGEHLGVRAPMCMYRPHQRFVLVSCGTARVAAADVAWHGNSCAISEDKPERAGFFKHKWVTQSQQNNR